MKICKMFVLAACIVAFSGCGKLYYGDPILTGSKEGVHASNLDELINMSYSETFIENNIVFSDNRIVMNFIPTNANTTYYDRFYPTYMNARANKDDVNKYTFDLLKQHCSSIKGKIHESSFSDGLVYIIYKDTDDYDHSGIPFSQMYCDAGNKSFHSVLTFKKFLQTNAAGSYPVYDFVITTGKDAKTVYTATTGDINKILKQTRERMLRDHKGYKSEMKVDGMVYKAIIFKNAAQKNYGHVSTRVNIQLDNSSNNKPVKVSYKEPDTITIKPDMTYNVDFKGTLANSYACVFGDDGNITVNPGMKCDGYFSIKINNLPDDFEITSMNLTGKNIKSTPYTGFDELSDEYKNELIKGI